MNFGKKYVDCLGTFHQNMSNWIWDRTLWDRISVATFTVKRLTLIGFRSCVGMLINIAHKKKDWRDALTLDCLGPTTQTYEYIFN